MPQYKYRGFRISIATTRVGEECQVTTEIFLPPSADRPHTYRRFAKALQIVSMRPVLEIDRAALDSAKATIDGHIAALDATDITLP